MCIYIYIYRERERDRYVYVCIHIHLYAYIVIMVIIVIYEFRQLQGRLRRMSGLRGEDREGVLLRAEDLAAQGSNFRTVLAADEHNTSLSLSIYIYIYI